MSTTRRLTAMLLVTGLTVLLPTVIAMAQDRRLPRSDDPRYREQRRLIEESERASRARPPSPPRAPPIDDGVQQIPIDTSRRSGFFKEEGKEPDVETLRLRGPDSTAPPLCPYDPSAIPPWKIASFVKAFPEVTWHVCVRDMGLKALWLGPVHLKRTPISPWMPVLYQAGLADIFVPYHQTNFRPYDLQFTSKLAPVGPQDAGNGTWWALTNDFDNTGTVPVPTVITEVRERGVGWLCKGPTTSAARRAQEFVVWGVSDAGNYDNIIQYGFRDDGGMTFRMGNTGFNASKPPPTNPTPFEAHTHNALWRVDMDLNGPLHNWAYWLRHREPYPVGPFQAHDDKLPFNFEGKRQWNALQFTSLLIEDMATNAFGNRLGYQFTPAQTGISRHYGPLEAWTKNDVYVTRYKASELGWITAWDYPDNYLLPMLNSQPVNNNDLVVWIKSSAHHHPNDEDRSSADLNTVNSTGVTLTHWSGFDVEPHNLFNANPLGGPVRCYP
jgi:primary-amine oxidase